MTEYLNKIRHIYKKSIKEFFKINAYINKDILIMNLEITFL